VTDYDADARDPGLAAERTDLAWDRSGLSLLACGALILRGLGQESRPTSNVALGTLVLALGVLTWLLGTWHTTHARHRGGRPTTLRDLAPVSIGVALIGVSAFVVSSAW
jgi:uncharacterized membrane protein YidH (DUF202 family)